MAKKITYRVSQNKEDNMFYVHAYIRKDGHCKKEICFFSYNEDEAKGYMRCLMRLRERPQMFKDII